MSNEIRELTDDDLDQVSGGLRSQSIPTHPSTGPTYPPDSGDGPVVLNY